MIISFFEEFPSSRVLKKAEKISFPFNLYIADYSIDSFKLYAKEIKNKHLKKCIWWPLLPKEAGYWISGFAGTSALQRLFKNLENERISVMLDLEYPKRRFLILKNLFKVSKNKRLIFDFIEKYKGEIYNCEYFPDSNFFRKFDSLFGLDVDAIKYNTTEIKMYYSSMHKFSDEFLLKHFKYNVDKLGNRFIVGLGTIAVGINKNEPILSVKELGHDLELCKKAGVSEVIIYRLEGLNSEYLKMLEGFGR